MEEAAEEPGKVYAVDETGKAFIANKRAQRGVIGICSDTYGASTGEDKTKKQVPVGVSGFVLAYVDKIYPPGTELVNDRNGNLTKANWFEKIFKRESVVGTFYRAENNLYWNGVKVNKRMWCKII